MFQVDLNDVSQVLYVNFKDVSNMLRKLQGCFRSASKVLKRKYQKCVKFQGGIMQVLRVF